MAEGFSTINSTITIKNKDSTTSYVFTAEVFNFKESGVTRKIDFTPIVGGRVVSRLNNPLNYTVSFDFTLIDGVIEGLTSVSDWYFNTEDDDVNKFLIQLDFTNTTSQYTKRYYEAYITEFIINNNNDILEGNIKFTLPSISINGNETIFIDDSITAGNAYNLVMGY